MCQSSEPAEEPKTMYQYVVALKGIDEPVRFVAEAYDATSSTTVVFSKGGKNIGQVSMADVLYLRIKPIDGDSDAEVDWSKVI